MKGEVYSTGYNIFGQLGQKEFESKLKIKIDNKNNPIKLSLEYKKIEFREDNSGNIKTSWKFVFLFNWMNIIEILIEKFIAGTESFYCLDKSTLIIFK